MEEEIKPFLDENGYLSVKKRYEFLASKGIIRFLMNEPCLVKTKFAEYVKVNEEIDKFLKLTHKSKKGYMGVDSEKVIHKIIQLPDEETNTITADEVDF